MEDKTIIGVDLGGTNIRVGKIYNDKVTDLYTRQISSTGIEQKVIDEIITSIKKIFNNSILGIGVGVPSVVDVEKGIVYDVQNIPAFRKVYLKDILEKEFKVPVYINNDANCFVVGEKYFGAGKNYKDIVGLILGTGLGSGIYTNDKLYMGANCGAGEFGEIFNEFGYHVGKAISAIVLSVDPEIIILGGSVSKAYDYFKNSLNIALDTFPYQNSIKRLKIVVSKLKQVSILGAAALYFENKK
ncbi:MAG: ROK family protein [Ignavibacteriaceae bacterium]